MVKEKLVYGLSLLTFLFFLPLDSVQAQTEPLHQRPIISVMGRLALEKHGEEEWLVLHAKNAETYLIKGNLTEKLKNLLLELGEDNLVFVTGNQDGRSNVSSERSYRYEYNDEGERVLKIDVKAIRYYYLDVTQILFAKESDEAIPPPKRDIEEERRLMASKGVQGLEPLIRGELYGKITSVNLRAPIKTIEITNRDKSSPLKKMSLIISSNTRVARKLGEQEEIMALSPKALKRGQEVTVVYSREGVKNEALFITITKE